jgi:hypothetical protein
MSLLLVIIIIIIFIIYSLTTVTTEIARFVHQVINLPADVNAALARLEKLELDVLLFPDWQPFPDQQSIFFQSIRIAPVQVW